jgi:hypothetical protein
VSRQASGGTQKVVDERQTTGGPRSTFAVGMLKKKICVEGRRGGASRLDILGPLNSSSNHSDMLNGNDCSLSSRPSQIFCHIFSLDHLIVDSE